MRGQKGVGVLLSDLADGATYGRASGTFKHTKAYYQARKASGGRQTEIFANVVGISGEGEISARMVERLFPELYRSVMELLETIG